MHAKFQVLMTEVEVVAASLMLNEAGLQHCVVASSQDPGDNLMLIPAPGQTAGGSSQLKLLN